MSSEDFHDAASERERSSSAPRQPDRGQGQAPLTRIASAVGNRGFARTIARMRDGDGILPSGIVHPDVEAAIVTARGRGLPADRAVTDHVGATLGDSLSDVRIHRDADAAALARSVSARAFTVGNDIFFGSGEYEPTTPAGRELLTHELVHVVQQRGAAPGGPLTVSQPGDALEREAEDVSHDI
jgi:Domain of unknown function (DUF4157)